MSDEEKLEKYEAMHREVLARYREAVEALETLKAEGKSKTITFREKMGAKGFYSQILTLYRSYGISD